VRVCTTNFIQVWISNGFFPKDLLLVSLGQLHFVCPIALHLLQVQALFALWCPFCNYKMWIRYSNKLSASYAILSSWSSICSLTPIVYRWRMQPLEISFIFAYFMIANIWRHRKSINFNFMQQEGIILCALCLIIIYQISSRSTACNQSHVYLFLAASTLWLFHTRM